jgi:hypothetical protein
VKSVHLTIFAAVGVLSAGSPSFAGDRHAYRQYTPVSGYYTPKSAQTVSYEQKCMILPCGSRWCYKVRR